MSIDIQAEYAVALLLLLYFASLESQTIHKTKMKQKII